ncbi:Uma2 family endonuclease [soil metagenome]
MASPVSTGLTYADLERLPDDGLTRELIDGDLYVTARPVRRHQYVAGRITRRLLDYTDEHGGEAYPEPGVYFSEVDYVAPDAVIVGPAKLAGLDERFVDASPDLVVEVSSPTTRRVDLVRKRALYERERVAEFWFVDLDADRIEVYRLTGQRYGRPALVGPGERLQPSHLPGLVVDVDDALGLAGPREGAI